MAKALIVSLGGTLEPVIKSIGEHKPDYVCFFSSQKSNAEVYPKIKEVLDKKGISPEKESVIVDDENDLVHCYEKALEVSNKVLRRRISPQDVVVDYTGGTKNMTAALTLATVANGFRFSYVGGKERTKEGLGIVVSGTEEVKTALSPWQVLYVEDRKKMALFFNCYQFSAARDIADRLKAVLGGLDKAVYESLSDLVEGYRLWDSFDHDKSLRLLGDGRKKLSEYAGLKGDSVLIEFAEAVRGNLVFLGEMKARTNNFKDKHFLLAFDLFHNARRRAEEGKYDDAVARLYRALEMVGQIEFEREFKCSTSDAKPERLPEPIREEIIRKHKSDDGKIRIPLKDTFIVLNETGNEFGNLFINQKEEIDKIMSARNGSILAHGVIPIPKESFEKLSSIVEGFLKHTGVKCKVEFPKLQW